MKYTFLGHNTFMFEVDGKNIIVDPWITSPICTLNVEDIKVDYILITHGHFDHIGETVELLKLNKEAKVIANPEILRYLTSQGVEESATIPQYIGGYVDHKDFSLKGTLAVHGSSLPDGSYGGVAMGFVIKSNNGKKVYIAGDTGLTMDMSLLAYENVDLAILPIGGRFTMDVEDAVRATKMIEPKKVLPCHYDTFPIIVEDPKNFENKIKEEKIKVEVEILEVDGLSSL